MTTRRPVLSALALAVLAACSSGSEPTPGPVDPYAGTPPLGTAIAPGDGSAILDGATDTGWRWVPFDDSLCTDADGTTSTTGLAINWGTGADLVIFMQGGGACWDYFTCGFLHTATTGPFGPSQFVTSAYVKYPNSWARRANLPTALADATIVFVPYCTGDVHAGNAVTTYTQSGLPSVTWHHVGHANLMAFLKRLGATFPSPGKLVVAGSSAGGFGALVDYPAFRWYWPGVKSYLVDDSGPPLIGSAIPASTHAAMYSSWNLGEALDYFCPGCRTDLSKGMAEVAAHFPSDRIALVSHLQDQVIRKFFYDPATLSPMDAAVFETQLRLLGESVMDPATTNAKYFFTNSPTPGTHPALDDPTAVTTPGAGLVDWLAKMVSDDAAWVSAADP